ncbi:ribulose-phosphate 3-epimerase [Elusimicrobiota bacterium]
MNKNPKCIKPNKIRVQTNGSPIIAASILAADPLNLEDAIKECERAGNIEWIQVDVMDGDFTPNLSFGPALVASIAQRSRLVIDVHLMVSKPYLLIEEFAKSGAHLITVHSEAKDSPEKCLKLINKLGKLSGIAIKPSTPLTKIKKLLNLADLLLVMTVDPGFAGQSYIKKCTQKIKEARTMLKKYPNVKYLEVDGGINEGTIGEARTAGANVFVCGSSVFKNGPAMSAQRLWRALKR